MSKSIETDDPDVADFDLNAWIEGAQPTTRSVTLYQRGDLVSRSDELNAKLQRARQIPAADRTMGDPSPESVLDEIETLAEEFAASKLVITVRGRDDVAHKKVRDRVNGSKSKGQKVDEDEITLHLLEDSIVTPKGITVEWLRSLRSASQAQYQMVLVAAAEAKMMPPVVNVPFSPGGSSDRRPGDR